VKKLARVGAPTGLARKDYEIRKGFTRKPQRDEPATPLKNYITPSGLDRLKDEHRFLLTKERPAVTEVKCGDRRNVARFFCPLTV
jgi:hypothetical protein